MIAPKSHFTQHSFVDREGHIQTFKEAVDNIGQKEYSVLVYYGVAGIGKTSLRKELSKYLEKTYFSSGHPKVIWTSIDLHLAEHREKNTFLVTLKNDLQKKYQINFPAFEIAHAIYWKKANPEIPLRKENYLLFEGDNAFDDYFGVVDKIPYFSVVPAAARLLKNSPDYLRKWWTKRGEVELQELPEKEPLEIEEMLPYFWAQDLNNYLENTSISAVLLIDTYEALWENRRSDGNSRDEWIREELILRLPKQVLWVIFGREALGWEGITSEWNDFASQYEIEELLRKYCIEYLENREITDKEIQEAIFNGSKGVPYYLELSVYIYEKIAKTRKPRPEDFGDSHQKIADRFFRFLSHEEKNTFDVLAVPRFWDYDLFKYLVKEFSTGYSINNYEDLCNFSFIGKNEREKQQMHQLMQECLLKTQKKKRPDSVKKIHETIREYYTKRLDNLDIKAITQEDEIALTEAFYHAKESLETEYLLKWLVSASDPFDTAASWQLIIPMYEELIQIIETKLGLEHPDVATSLNNLAALYNDMGEYEVALPLYQKAFEINKKVLGPNQLRVAKSLNNLAGLYIKMGEYEEALPRYRRALEISEKTLGPNHPDVSASLNNLAALCDNMGKYEEALPFYQRALEISEKTLGPNHLDFVTYLNNLSSLYCQMGEYEEAFPLYQRALEIREKTLGPNHPDVATSLNNLALLYDNTGKYEEALPLYQRALEISEKTLGPNHPDVATSLNNLALLYRHMGEYKETLPLYQRALEIREKTLGPNHPGVATLLNNIALLYDSMREYDVAFLLYQRTLEIGEKVLGPNHPDVATYLNNLALLYRHMGEYKEAFPLYQRALDIRERTLGPNHPDIANSLNNLAFFYENRGEYEEALPLYQRALKIREKVLGRNHPNTIIVRNNLEQFIRNMNEEYKN